MAFERKPRRRGEIRTQMYNLSDIAMKLNSLAIGNDSESAAKVLDAFAAQFNLRRAQQQAPQMRLYVVHDILVALDSVALAVNDCDECGQRALDMIAATFSLQRTDQRDHIPAPRQVVIEQVAPRLLSGR